ncbi:MAG: NAD(P)-dependent oxidoreductase, partial [Patescibacteria group bacterium]|nr:NAD(P)-dependent oxidoreductase [Patescibacteria group bacterium]
CSHPSSVLELLETCRAKQFSPKIVFASSANLVGLTDRLPVDETFADRPLTIYAIHKLTAERYLKYYAENYDIKSVILRLSNVYGPSVDLESFRRVAFNRMIAAAFGTGKLMLFRNRHCVRDYLYIDDAIAAFLAGGSSKKTGDGNFYVIGNEKGYNFGEFAKLIAEKVSAQTGRQVEIASDEITELVPAEFRNFVADSARFKKLTGWKTEISLGQGIEKTLSYLAKVS